MTKFNWKKVFKIGIITACVSLLGILLLFGFTVFRIGSELTKDNQKDAATDSTLMASPFNNFNRIEIQEVEVSNDARKNLKPYDNSAQNISKLNAKERSNFSLEGLSTVLNAKLVPLRLCDINCHDLNEFIIRIRKYSNGDFSGNNNYLIDPAFQLAARMGQIGLGPAGISALKIIHEVEKNPLSIASVKELSKLFWQVDDIVKAFAEGKKTRALEADELMNVLQYEANSCRTKQWEKKCTGLETDIEMWVSRGRPQ